MSETDDTEPLIETEEELRHWLDGHADRHARQPDDSCACGWPHISEGMKKAFAQAQEGPFRLPTYAAHFKDVLFADLGHVLPSGHREQGEDALSQPIAWSPLVTGLYATIDRRESEIDPRFVVLMRHLLTLDAFDVLALANITVMHPHYLARLLNTALPEQGPPDTAPQALHEAPAT